MSRVKRHKRKGRIVSEHTRKNFRSIRSSFIDKIESDGVGGYNIVILGVKYPYPYLPNEKVGGIVGGAGKYYNKHIRGKYF